MTKIKSTGMNGTGTKIIKSSLPKTVKKPGQKAHDKGQAEKIKKELDKSPFKKTPKTKSKADYVLLNNAIKDIIDTTIDCDFYNATVHISEEDSDLFRSSKMDTYFEYFNTVNGEPFDISFVRDEAVKKGKYVLEFVGLDTHDFEDD